MRTITDLTIYHKQTFNILLNFLPPELVELILPKFDIYYTEFITSYIVNIPKELYTVEYDEVYFSTIDNIRPQIILNRPFKQFISSHLYSPKCIIDLKCEKCGEMKSKHNYIFYLKNCKQTPKELRQEEDAYYNNIYNH